MTNEINWQSRFKGRQWAVVGDELISRDPETGVRAKPHGTLGEPVTIRRYLDAWGEEIRAASEATGVPVPLLLATIATENGPARPGPEKGLGFMPPRFRGESGGRVSVGPCHVLVGTARAAMGDDSIDRDWLADLGNNLMAAACYIRDGQAQTGWDPILVAARYNSGGLYGASSPRSSYHNRWHLKSTGSHLDRFADWYGDALAVQAERSAGRPVESDSEDDGGTGEGSTPEEREMPVDFVPDIQPDLRRMKPPLFEMKKVDQRRVRALYSSARQEEVSEDEFKKALRVLARWLDDVLSDVPWYARAITVLRSLRDLIRALT